MTDYRVFRTNDILVQSFLNLLIETDIQKITIKSICEKACVNRSTFYAHFQNIYEFYDYVEVKMADDFMATLMPYKFDMNVQDVIADMFNLMKENKALCYVFFHPNSSGKGLERIYDKIKVITLPVWLAESDISEEQAELLLLYITGGSYRILKRWYLSNFSIDKDMLIKLFENVLKYGIYDFLYVK